MSRDQGWRASKLIGKEVRNSAGEVLGKLDELVVDPLTGSIAFGILSFGGVLGMGNKQLAIPWSALGMVPGKDHVLLDMEPAVLEKAPYFESSQIPDFSDAVARTRIYQYYGYPDPGIGTDRTIVVQREYHSPKKKMSASVGLLLVLLLLGVVALTYMVKTRGWDQAKSEIVTSAQSVTYAMKETGGDAALTAKVKTALSLNKRVPAANINVDSEDGFVTLRGEVNTDETRGIAGMIAQDTPGVREVRNHLYVMQPGK